MAIGKILVGHDFSEPANRALRFADAFAMDSGATLEIVHIQPDPYDGRGELELALPAGLHGQGERYFRFLEEEVRRVALEVLGPERGAVPCHVLRGDPVKHIKALAKEIGADAICIAATGKGAVQRFLLGSVSLLVLRSASLPVLLVP